MRSTPFHTGFSSVSRTRMNATIGTSSNQPSTVSSSAWQNLLVQVQDFISVIEDDLDQRAQNEYASRTAYIGLASDLYSQVNTIMKETTDFSDLNSSESKNIVTFIEDQKIDVVGVYEAGEWIVPDDLPSDYPLDGTHWVNLEQLNAIATEFENFISLSSDSTPLEVLQKQALFQQLTQQYSFMVQLIAQRNELLKTIIQAIR